MDQGGLLRSLQELLSDSDVSMASLEQRVDAVLSSAGEVLEADGAALLMFDDHDQSRRK